MEPRLSGSCENESDLEDDVDDLDYYAGLDDDDIPESMEAVEDKDKDDLEAYDFCCLTEDETLKKVTGAVQKVLENLKMIYPSMCLEVARLLLQKFKWNEDEVLKCFRADPRSALSLVRWTQGSNKSGRKGILTAGLCEVCFLEKPAGCMYQSHCGHVFCTLCWNDYIKVQLGDGCLDIICMDSLCSALVNSVEDLLNPSLKAQYWKCFLRNCIDTHPLLRWCVGADCQVVIEVTESKPGNITCKKCRTSFCFLCARPYHAPADCKTLATWLQKSKDDSETANYIRANTKDCPSCHVCIEKSGGCNHMQCSKCLHDFCWMCLKDWNSHNREYYECSQYKASPESESDRGNAREALNRYLFYYDRWENHSQSLKLESETWRKINSRIDEKVSSGEGTWIDWQYLKDACQLLLKSRETLKYTYPVAYIRTDSGKDLFAYQQAQLEREIENLSWKIERAESTDRGDIEYQMVVTRTRRLTLLKDQYYEKQRRP